MPRDDVFISVNNSLIEDVVSYEFDSDLFLAADAFNFEAKQGDVRIMAGDSVKQWVNNKPALSGIVSRTQKKGNKREGLRISASGTDLMGLLCGSGSTVIGDIATGYGGATSVTLNYLVEFLLRDIPGTLINPLTDVVYQPGTSNLSIAFDQISVSPGQSIFEILRQAAASRGLHFWCDESGKFLFGKPESVGAPNFFITRRKNSLGNNVIDGQSVMDIDDGFSKVVIYGQTQDFDGGDNVVASAELLVPGEFPFYRVKTIQINGDKNGPALEAKRLLNQVKAKLFQHEYTVPGHSQNGLNYTTNVIAHVDDEDLDVRGDYLVYARKFTVDKENGPVTILRLGMPGVIYNA